MARMASTAAWGRGEWAAMVQSVSLLPRDSQDGAFYRAVLCVHNQVSWCVCYVWHVVIGSDSGLGPGVSAD